MEIIIKAIGKEKSQEVKQLTKDYLVRTKWQITTIEHELTKTLSENEQKSHEGKWLINNVNENSFVYVLDERGQQFTSREFSEHLVDKMANNKNTYFLIGGAFGLSEEVKQQASKLVSFGKMTFPHKLVRLMLIEQLYRAYSIQNNHTYHK